MQTFVPYAVWAIIIVICLGVIGMLAFGLRSLVQGKAQPITVGVMTVPAVILVLLGLILGNWAMAAIWTTIIMFALGMLALFSSGVWGLFT
ncbi:MAG: hypothetical protein BRD47_07225 [Bacteroidetes bacterium QS_8_68_28]|jgi:hypothetical protein|nr:MAG: hypothetical protein BRD47_07225 [Bacteroidetes bacterium QS_8_68_28]